MTDDVLFAVESGVVEITLNRPEALNALTLEMIQILHERLSGWAVDDSVRAIVVRGAGDRAFCAGGDIRALYDAKQVGGPLTRDFFRHEYQLNHLIFHYPKTYIALVDGIAMGGGVGLSVHAGTCIASEVTMFAMPETGIGLFPDVGGSYFLSRCPGAIGMYLALTGARLRAADCLYAGIGEYYVETTHHNTLIESLRDGAAVDQALALVASDPGAAPLTGMRETIDRIFSGGSVEAVLAALRAEGGEWAEKTLHMMAGKSPVSQKIACRQLQEGSAKDFDACMVMEYRLSQNIMAAHDFFEGVRALIVDKDNAPIWRPDSLDAVDNTAVAGFFAPLDEGDLTFSALQR